MEPLKYTIGGLCLVIGFCWVVPILAVIAVGAVATQRVAEQLGRLSVLGEA